MIHGLRIAWHKESKRMFSALTRCRLKRRWRRVCATYARHLRVAPLETLQSERALSRGLPVTREFSSLARSSVSKFVRINVRDYRIKILKIHLYWSFVNKCVLNYFEIIKERLLRFISNSMNLICESDPSYQ